MYTSKHILPWSFFFFFLVCYTSKQPILFLFWQSYMRPHKKPALESALNTAREEPNTSLASFLVLNNSGEYTDRILKTTILVAHLHLNMLHESIRYQWCTYKNITAILFCCSSFGGILGICFCTSMDNHKETYTHEHTHTYTLLKWKGVQHNSLIQAGHFKSVFQSKWIKYLSNPNDKASYSFPVYFYKTDMA